MCAEDGYRQGFSISHQDLARRGRVESFLFKNFAQQTQRERICRVKLPHLNFEDLGIMLGMMLKLSCKCFG